MVDSPNPERREAVPPRVSVVMPCFNAERYLEQAVRSVMDQTLRAVELIVVDDGSSDQSPQIVSRLQAEFGDRIVHASQVNAGPYAARNHGLRLARGSFVAFLDSDDWWAPDCLEKLHAALLADANAALTYCGWQNIGLEGGRGAPYVPPDYELEDKAARFLRAAAPWPIHAALVRRSVIDEVGGFDLDLPTCMDYDLWLRIAVGRPIRLVPEVLAFYRHHQSGQITSTQWRQARNSWLVKRKFVRQHPQLVRHLSRGELKDLIDGSLLSRGYDKFWRRDLDSAQRIFRMSLVKGGWGAKDLVYLLPSLLPSALYRKVVLSRDRGPRHDSLRQRPVHPGRALARPACARTVGRAQLPRPPSRPVPLAALRPRGGRRAAGHFGARASLLRLLRQVALERHRAPPARPRGRLQRPRARCRATRSASASSTRRRAAASSAWPTSRAWNWQQGAMAQWHPADLEKRFMLQRPARLAASSACCATSTRASSASSTARSTPAARRPHRVQRSTSRALPCTAPATATPASPTPQADDPHPAGDGIWRVDLASGRSRPDRLAGRARRPRSEAVDARRAGTTSTTSSHHAGGQTHRLLPHLAPRRQGLGGAALHLPPRRQRADLPARHRVHLALRLA